MKKKALIIWLSAAWVFLMLVLAGGATYAWFTFQPYTNVEPISSTISDGEVALLIAADPEAEFGTQCVLPQNSGGNLEPVSTADLVSFFGADSQSRQGISTKYLDRTENVEEDTLHGVFYLQSLKDNCDVYFYRSGMNFGTDIQMLAALRLGLRITVGEEEKSYIFALNSMENTSNAVSRQTTARPGAVISALESDGSPVYVDDPARELDSFFAVPAGNDKIPKAGREALCTIQAGQTATVEYWLYLEGCDANCVNEVQERDAGIALSFAGVTAQ